jgi:hypothetical protein
LGNWGRRLPDDHRKTSARLPRLAVGHRPDPQRRPKAGLTITLPPLWVWISDRRALRRVFRRSRANRQRPRVRSAGHTKASSAHCRQSHAAPLRHVPVGIGQVRHLHETPRDDAFQSPSRMAIGHPNLTCGAAPISPSSRPVSTRRRSNVRALSRRPQSTAWLHSQIEVAQPACRTADRFGPANADCRSSVMEWSRAV